MTTKDIYNTDVQTVSRERYWRTFGRLIQVADVGVVLGVMGWVFYWMDRVPDPLFHTHIISQIMFLTGLLAGLYGSWIIIRKKVRLGTRRDHVLHIIFLSYAILAGLLGLMANYMYPLH